MRPLRSIHETLKQMGYTINRHEKILLAMNENLALIGQELIRTRKLLETPKENDLVQPYYPEKKDPEP